MAVSCCLMTTDQTYMLNTKSLDGVIPSKGDGTYFASYACCQCLFAQMYIFEFIFTTHGMHVVESEKY